MSKSSGPVRPTCSSTPPTSRSTLFSKRQKCCRYEAFRSRLGSLPNCSRLVVRLPCSQLRRWFRTGTTTVASYDTRRPFMITGASSGDRGHDQRERRPYRQHGGAGFDGCREGSAKVFGVAAVTRRVDVDVMGVEDQPAPPVAILSDELLRVLERDALTVQLVGPQLVPVEHTDVRPATRAAGRATVAPRHGR